MKRISIRERRTFFRPFPLFCLLLTLALTPAQATDTDTLVGKELAPFQVTAFDGSMVRSEDFAGKVWVVDFWATWCQPCLNAMPALQELYDHYDGKVEFLMLNTGWNDSLLRARGLIQKNGYTFPTAFDTTQKLAKELGIFKIPTTLVIDASGTVRFRHEGFGSVTEVSENLRAEIDSLLEATEGAPAESQTR
ncbi:MAG: TlpA disulfide reductase family protein [Acidobacteriota bacterium]